MGELLAGGTILVTALIICGTVLFSLVITVAAVGIPIYLFRQSQKKTAELMKIGVPGEAKVLELQDTGMRINDNPRVTLTLEVNVLSQEPFQIKKTATVSIIRLSQIQVGSIINITVDPSDFRNPDKMVLNLK